MGKKITASEQAALEIVQEVQDMLEAEDGKFFEEKKTDIIKILDGRMMECENERMEKRKKHRDILKVKNPAFWDFGDKVYSDERILVRRVVDTDREKFMELQQENMVMPSMFKQDDFKDYLWEEHIVPTALMCSIIDITTGEYVGYCGIKNTSLEKWEIAIEILEVWKHKGIGFLALQKLLDAAASRSGVTEFRVRVDSDNYASQGLFEKLGAVPNGISEFLLHDEEELRRCEEDNMQYLDEKLETVAKKFGVEPRLLLSHVLEYRLEWSIGEAAI